MSESFSMGERLRAAIRAKGHTQREAARVLGVTEPWISDLCNDKARPSINMAAKLETEYGIPMRDWAEVA